MAATASLRDRIARQRARQSKLGLRPVVLWLPNASDPAYRARLAQECRQLATFTPDEAAVADGFRALVARTDGWR
jgi:hypothetical protein